MKGEGEPYEEDRILPFQEDHETIMNMGCNFKSLQAGCTALGLLGRGGKSKCFKRMVDHLKAQALIAAHGAAVKRPSEMEHVPHGQFKPEEPSQQKIENHALAHEASRIGVHCVFNTKQDRMRTHQVITNKLVSSCMIGPPSLWQQFQPLKREERALQHLVTETTRSLNTKNLLSGLIVSRPSILAETLELQSMMKVLQSWTINQTVLLK